MSHSSTEKLQLKTDDVVWRDVGDELVVLELSTSTYLTLNGAARHIWESLATGVTLEALVTMLTERYGISQEQATVDANSFLSALADRDLLVSES